MSFPRYPAYKSSCVEWLGEVPEHWDEKPLKTVTSINDEILPESLSPDYEIEYIDISSVSLANGIEKTETMPFSDAPSRARRIPRDGDVLVSTVRTYLKAIAPVVNPPSNLVASTGFAVVRPRDTLEPGFLKYALQEERFIQQVISRSTGVSYPAINASDVAKISLGLPGSSEQIAIATFLDRETGKIDALIDEQQRLIELLQEKRQAVISHAVTKGLNPDAPMKDSGVEWLGQVPEHWDVLPVWMIFFLGRGRVISHEEISRRPGNYPVFSSQTEDNGEMGRLETFDFEGDYLTWTTDGANAGSVFRRSGRFNCTNVCGTLKAKTPAYVNLDFALACLRLATRAYVRMDINPKLMNNVMASIKIPIPPSREQDTIARHLSKETHDFYPLEDAIKTQLELLQERRSALISAAVTGQIDVRGLVPEAEAA